MYSGVDKVNVVCSLWRTFLYITFYYEQDILTRDDISDNWYIGKAYIWTFFKYRILVLGGTDISDIGWSNDIGYRLFLTDMSSLILTLYFQDFKSSLGPVSKWNAKP